ncbi:acetylornithine transaminase [Acaricomes phytoseiuli]|uniref:acetylornithine transaminase n=1 Tax=Acaricomes phytoseiuli TaxID=291968 RepID=UPI00039B9F4A|nr:acetylornithine transaminase [Acaricomes phytoseiuli]MCW1248848.1 acetylornithine transaminase [Acaricomes phytoseiuli]
MTEQSGAAWQQRYESALLGVFGTPQRVLVRGEGAVVWDADGQDYLDLLGGIAVNALGHGHPALISAITKQLETLGHISNFFASPPQIALAERLLALAGAPESGRVFLTNSGTEANEAAYKLARAYGNQRGKGRILALTGGFHGRSTGALALTAKPQYRAPFEPLPPVEHLAAGDREALREALAARDVAALVLEPIQGEAGVHPLPPGYLAAARQLTREAGALLIVDEVQTGAGRTGAWFAYPECYGPGHGPAGELTAADLPDATTLAKGLGAGFPVGALLTFSSEVSGVLSAGAHGTTFGGNPVAAAAALATLQVIEDDGLLAAARERGEQLSTGLAALPQVAEVRGAGLLIGFDLKSSQSGGAGIAPAVVQAGLSAGYLLNATGPKTLRLAPPLILSESQAAQFLADLPALLDRAAGIATEDDS